MAIIHTQEGLNIKSLSHIYKESHVVSHATSRLKADSQVNAALDSKVTRERGYTRKGSISTASEDCFQNSAHDIPDEPNKTYIETVKKRVKQNIEQEINSTWINHVKSLTVQGRFLEILSIEQSNITWKSIAYNLPRNILQFATNACIDTLATNANLKRWGKRGNAKCNSCGQRETLHHTLNNCQVMLERYKWRHDSILNYLHNVISNSIRHDYEIYTDLPATFRGVSTLPLDIAVTTLRPDLIVVNRLSRKVIMFELSVPFEINIDTTHQLKVNRYRQLVADIEDNGYKVNYFPVEIGSRAYISKDNINRLKAFLKDTTTNVKFNNVKSDVCKIVLIASFVIFHSKHEVEWISPSYVALANEL